MTILRVARLGLYFTMHVPILSLSDICSSHLSNSRFPFLQQALVIYLDYYLEQQHVSSALQ